MQTSVIEIYDVHVKFNLVMGKLPDRNENEIGQNILGNAHITSFSKTQVANSLSLSWNLTHVKKYLIIVVVTWKTHDFFHVIRSTQFRRSCTLMLR